MKKMRKIVVERYRESDLNQLEFRAEIPLYTSSYAVAGFVIDCLFSSEYKWKQADRGGYWIRGRTVIEIW